MRIILLFLPLCFLLACQSGEPADATQEEPTAESAKLSEADSIIQNRPKRPTKRDTSSLTQAGKVPVQAAKITYQLGGVQEGTETLYFDQYGERLYKLMDFVMGDNQFKQVILWDGEKQWVYQLQSPATSNVGFIDESSNKPGGLLGPFAGMTAQDIGTGTDINVLPDETIAGKPCQVYERQVSGGSIQYWVWKGINLGEKNMAAKSSTGQPLTRMATAFEEIEEIPASFFEIPKGFRMRK